LQVRPEAGDPPPAEPSDIDPAPAWLPDRYQPVRMTATHLVRRDRGTDSQSPRPGGRIPWIAADLTREDS
jgi:hypothetical protein